MTSHLIKDRVLDPIRGLLSQGLTPTRLAFCLSAGTVLACFPVLGSTTLLCAAFAFAFRLNQAAIQLANWLAYPLQLLLLIPLYRAGATLFGDTVNAPESVDGVIQLIRDDAWLAIHMLWNTTLKAVAVWGLGAVPAAGLLYVIFRAILRRLPMPLMESA